MPKVTVSLTNLINSQIYLPAVDDDVGAGVEDEEEMRHAGQDGGPGRPLHGQVPEVGEVHHLPPYFVDIFTECYSDRTLY